MSLLPPPLLPTPPAPLVSSVTPRVRESSTSNENISKYDAGRWQMIKRMGKRFMIASDAMLYGKLYQNLISAISRAIAERNSFPPNLHYTKSVAGAPRAERHGSCMSHPCSPLANPTTLPPLGGFVPSKLFQSRMSRLHSLLTCPGVIAEREREERPPPQHSTLHASIQNWIIKFQRKPGTHNKSKLFRIFRQLIHDSNYWHQNAEQLTCSASSSFSLREDDGLSIHILRRTPYSTWLLSIITSSCFEFSSCFSSSS